MTFQGGVSRLDYDRSKNKSSKNDPANKVKCSYEYENQATYIVGRVLILTRLLFNILLNVFFYIHFYALECEHSCVINCEYIYIYIYVCVCVDVNNENMYVSKVETYFYLYVITRGGSTF